MDLNLYLMLNIMTMDTFQEVQRDSGNLRIFGLLKIQIPFASLRGTNSMYLKEII